MLCESFASLCYAAVRFIIFFYDLPLFQKAKQKNNLLFLAKNQEIRDDYAAAFSVTVQAAGDFAEFLQSLKYENNCRCPGSVIARRRQEAFTEDRSAR
ncbi:hypothetical protein ASF13_15590 [Erwinia sp. Leaf53]|nr:hypothetical protein ASF13_15590 [Erwinia sp. Leaf53]